MHSGSGDSSVAKREFIATLPAGTALDAAQRSAGIAAMPLEAASEHDLNWATNILELGH